MYIPTTIHTTRLDWRPLRPCDDAFIYRQFSDAQMCRYFSEPPCSYAEAQDIITFYRTSTGGRMRWMLTDRITRRDIGTCGYHRLDRTARMVEIGYDIWRDYWQQGYMREALPQLVQLCATYLPVDRIYALIDRDNVASRTTVGHAGFVQTNPCRTLDTDTQICMTYDITRR